MGVEEINDRILELVEFLGVSQNKFAESIGVSSARMSNVATKRNKPDSEFIQLILDKYRNVSAEWLISGRGVMMLNVNLNVNPSVNLINQNDCLQEPSGLDIYAGSRRGVILVPIKARAGYLAGYGDTEYIEKLEVYKIPGCRNGEYRMFEIEGDSMCPTMRGGDYVVGSRTNSLDELKPGVVYVIVSKEDGILIKRLVSSNKTTGKCFFSSDNPCFDTVEIDCSGVAEIWRAVSLLTSRISGEDPLAARFENLYREVEKIKRLLKPD